MVGFIKRLKCRASLKKAEIEFIRQKDDWDCLHTCFKMLGYKGHDIFPKGANTDEILEKIPFSKKLDLWENREKRFYDNPTLITTRTSFKDEKYHLILGYLRKIYDPGDRRGVYWAEKYMRYQFIEEMFEVPFHPTNL